MSRMTARQISPKVTVSVVYVVVDLQLGALAELF
jgi:hypothetical protein